MQHSGEEIGGFQLREAPLPCPKQGSDALGIIRKELQMQELIFATKGDCSGEVKTRWTGDASFSELNFAIALCQQYSPTGQTERALLIL